METFQGKAHLPGADSDWDITLEIDWPQKDVTVRIAQTPSGIGEWPGLAVQTFGPVEEISFRTRGIPPSFTHWWHLVRGGHDEMVGIILATPDAQGVWQTCPISMTKTGE
jgi:hypothetical protein